MDLKEYIELINNGEVVAFPTETVYGLGASAWNPSAIKKVFQIKGRPSDNPLIVHLSSPEQVQDFASEIPLKAEKLIEAFWPGPLTIILNKKPEVLDLITAGLNTVALRMPDHPIAHEFIAQTGPLVAPSANTSGRPSPTKAKHVQADFGDNFPVIDGGSTEVGLESTVVDLTGDHAVILRPGKIGEAELEDVLEENVISGQAKKEVLGAPKSPGQKYSHYKPAAHVFYGEIDTLEDDTLYLIQHKIDTPVPKNVIQYEGDLALLSKELYDRFRQADVEGYHAIYIESIEKFRKQQPSYYSALLNRIEKATSG